MDNQKIILCLLFTIVIFYYIQLDRHNHIQLNKNVINNNNRGHVKPEHLLYDVLQQFSSGDKITLSGKCSVNLYSKYIIDVNTKQQFTKLLNNIFSSIYGLTHRLFQVQELNNIYEQLDSSNNKRYVVDATLNSVSNYYTARVILDIVIINNEIFVNYINVNDASNNNIIDRYDVVFQDQGILFNHNNFSSNIRALLDTEYQKNNKLISVNSASLDSKNYNLENVMSLHSVLKKYLPSTLSSESEKNLQMKGLDGQLEMYFPPTVTTAKSPQFCDKYLNGWTSNSVKIPGSESCIFDQTNTQTEYNQPYMGPGLFFNRSSMPKQGY
tara:strand:- start:795 stop:1772 length:978 start_codon:yes stop_codon:yes gene_type:complete